MKNLQTWEPEPRRVRKSRNGSIAELLAEYLYLCPKKVGVLREHGGVNVDRQINNTIDKTIRDCHFWLAWSNGKDMGGHLYCEEGIEPGKDVIAEHAIPVSVMVQSHAKTGIALEELAFFPVALISRSSDKLFGTLKMTKTGSNETSPFSRYHAAGIKLQTFTGESVPCATWSMDNHWALLARAKAISSVRNDAISELTRRRSGQPRPQVTSQVMGQPGQRSGHGSQVDRSEGARTMVRMSKAYFGSKEVDVGEAIMERDQAQLRKVAKPEFRCVVCNELVRPHKAGGHSSAHFEHLARNEKCRLSDV